MLHWWFGEVNANASVHLVSAMNWCTPWPRLELSFVLSSSSYCSRSASSVHLYIVRPYESFINVQAKRWKASEALSGSFHQNMYSKMVTDSSRQLLGPLILYTTEATICDSNSWFCIEPFCFTPAILTHLACSRVDVGHPFGYVQQPRSNLWSDKWILSVVQTSHKTTMPRSLQC